MFSSIFTPSLEAATASFTTAMWRKLQGFSSSTAHEPSCDEGGSGGVAVACGTGNSRDLGPPNLGQSERRQACQCSDSPFLFIVNRTTTGGAPSGMFDLSISAKRVMVARRKLLLGALLSRLQRTGCSAEHEKPYWISRADSITLCGLSITTGNCSAAAISLVWMLAPTVFRALDEAPSK